MGLDANAIFEGELAKRGVAFQREGDFVYRVEIDGWIVSASLENVRKNAERDADQGVIMRFVDHVLAFSMSHPTWDDARTLLFGRLSQPRPISVTRFTSAFRTKSLGS